MHATSRCFNEKSLALPVEHVRITYIMKVKLLLYLIINSGVGSRNDRLNETRPCLGISGRGSKKNVFLEEHHKQKPSGRRPLALLRVHTQKNAPVRKKLFLMTWGTLPS